MSDTNDRTWAGPMPELYDRCLGPVLFEPFAADLARRVAALAPGAVLELAAGTGRLTANLRAAMAGARIVATDLNPAMVELGAARVPDVSWEPADALALPFDDDAFDLVACQFGVMFFPDRSAGYRQVRRVLRPGGHFVFNTWNDVAANDYAAALVEALTATCPHDPPTFVTRVPHGYHDLAQIDADLAAAGLAVVEAETLTVSARAASVRELAQGFCLGTPLRGELEARGELAALTDAVTEHMVGQLGEGPVERPLTAQVVTAG
jgi:ubiquinone/menaquinone biosynthesis C-methylase UbiE